MKTEFRTKRQLRKEIIKSAALLLLAVILLVSVALAWFRSAEDATIEPFMVRIKNNLNESELGSDIVAERVIVLPCATILGDPSISVSDFSKAVKVMNLQVESPLPNDVGINIETVPGLHFYIDTDYYSNNEITNEDGTTKTVLDYAGIIMENYNNGSGNNISKTMSFDLTEVTDPDGTVRARDLEDDGKYRHWVSVVYWADYDFITDNNQSIGDIINETGRIELNSTMSFKVIYDDAQ